MGELRARTAADVDTIITWVPDAAALRRFAGPRLSWPLTAAQMNVPATAAGTTAWVLEVDQHLTGHVQVTRTGRNAHLARVLVDPARRGAGHGRLLVASAIEEARRQGATRITLRVMADNPAALRLYTTLGFAPVPDQAADDMIAMARHL